MAIWDFRPKGDLWTGVAVGAGLLAAPVVIPLAWSATRPVLKAILKGGFMLYETGRQILGESTELPGRVQARAIVAEEQASAPRITKGTEQKEKLIRKVKAVEERPRSGRAKPKPEKKTRAKKEK